MNSLDLGNAGYGATFVSAVGAYLALRFALSAHKLPKDNSWLLAISGVVA
jgi:hypothetical protein